MNQENITVMLRKFIDNGVEILGKMVIKGLGVVSDRNINSLELVMELRDIIDFANALTPIRKYIISLMTPYAITVNFEGMPKTFSDMKSYFPHVYNIKKHNLMKVLGSVESPPCIFVISIRERSDYEIIKSFIEVYKGRKDIPGAIVFFEDSSRFGLGSISSEIESWFSSAGMTSPVMVIGSEILHKVSRNFYMMCKKKNEA